MNLERYESKIDRTGGPDACHPWTGAINDDGYGVWWTGTRFVRAHRLALELAGGLIVGLDAEHKCHTEDLACMGGPTCPHRRCANPKHLEAIPHRENVARGRRWPKQRAA